MTSHTAAYLRLRRLTRQHMTILRRHAVTL